MTSDYERAKAAGRTDLNRWLDGIDHHPMSERLMAFLIEHDFHDYDDHFCWKKGGDGDNGEALMYQMDAFFETLDREFPEINTADEAISAVWDEGFMSLNGAGLMAQEIIDLRCALKRALFFIKLIRPNCKTCKCPTGEGECPACLEYAEIAEEVEGGKDEKLT